LKKPVLFIGRFQPFHIGHLYALKEILSKEDQVFIVIGSAQASYTPANPFTTAERLRMVQSVLEEEKIPCTRFQIIPVPDVHNFTLWVEHVKRYVPPFSMVYTGSETGASLFSDQNIPITKISLYKKSLHSGTEIRRRMLKGNDWKHLVPDCVAKLIDEFDGANRVKSLSC
jgi:nicotinamide-nucleotide adenylyltransferase